jgi:hypothetical protein
MNMKPGFGCAGRSLAWSGWALFLLLAGCQQAEDPQVLQQRTRYLLNEEPKGALGVTEAHARLATQPDGGEQPLVLVGRIGAGDDQTWEPGKAAFVVVDPAAEIPSHDHGDGHSHDNCPFCQAEQKARANSIALIKILDASGNVVPVDARKLFSLVEGQLVVVSGTASIDALGNLVVAAQGVYPRQ